MERVEGLKTTNICHVWAKYDFVISTCKAINNDIFKKGPNKSLRAFQIAVKHRETSQTIRNQMLHIQRLLQRIKQSEIDMV